jgi:hypothetical protein
LPLTGGSHGLYATRLGEGNRTPERSIKLPID